jgi:hypothetical protein
MNGMLEALAYAIARGIARAWFEVKAEQTLAIEEKPDADDRRRAANFAGAIERVRSEPQGDPRFLDPTQGK